MIYTDVFVSDNLAMDGTIKTRAEDFEVREVHTSGKVAGEKTLLYSQLDPPVAKRSKDMPSNERNDNKTTLDIIDWSAVCKDVEGECQRLIGDKVDELKSLTCIDSSSVDCGRFDEKTDRTVLHHVVKYTYPHVTLNVVKSEKGHRNVVAVYDTNFSKLLEMKVERCDAERLVKFVHCRSIWERMNEESDTMFFSCNELTDDERKHLHHSLRKMFASFIDCRTVTKQSLKKICVRFKPPRKCAKRKLDSYQVVVLRKVNLETLDALRRVSDALGVNLSDVKYAGVKDKIAVTWQFASIANTSRDQIEQCCPNSASWDISYAFPQSSEVKLGDLLENQFKIVMRNVALQNKAEETSPVDVICLAAERLRSHGFVNYFGKQRFADDTSTPVIGRLLLQRKFEEAVLRLLKPQDCDAISEYEQAKRHFSIHKNADEALKLMPYHKVRERVVLRALKRFSFTEEGCVEAFKAIPYAQKLFYVHSYSSFNWNKLASQRCKNVNVMPGDLVFKNGSNNKEDLHYVTEQEVIDNTYSIFDVVYPLIGRSVVFPNNRFAKLFEDEIAKDDITLESFKIKELGITAQGAYRKLIERPRECIVMAHKDNFTAAGTNDVILNFALKPSCYATMLIRELLHNGASELDYNKNNFLIRN